MADEIPPTLPDTDVDHYDVNVWTALEDLIRYRVKMEVALRQIEIMANNHWKSGSPGALRGIKEIAHKGLEPPKDEEL